MFCANSLLHQLLFTSACVSALESVRYGVGKHNDAIPSLDDRVAALMVGLLPMLAKVLPRDRGAVNQRGLLPVAIHHDRFLPFMHDVCQTEHRPVSAATGHAKVVHLDSSDRSGHCYSVDHGHLHLEHVPVYPCPEAMGLSHSRWLLCRTRRSHLSCVRADCHGGFVGLVLCKCWQQSMHGASSHGASTHGASYFSRS